MALNSVCRLCKVIPKQLYSPQIGSVRHIKRWQTATLIALKTRDKIYREKTDPKKLLERERRSGFIEWNRSAEIYSFGKRLQEEFRQDLLDQAFLHRSYVELEKQKLVDLQIIGDNATLDNMKDNQDLVEIGERIISDHVWNYFSCFYPRFPLEGIQTIHDHLTSNQLLAHVSKNLGTTDLILSGDYPVEEETYATTMKAIVGALMESQGIDTTNIFVRDLIVTQFAGRDINDFLPIENYFKVITDIMKRDELEAPEPRIIGQTAVNTILANYHVGIYSNKKLYGNGTGESLEVAIEMASLDALKRLFHTTDSAKPLRYDAVLKYEGKLRNNLPLGEWQLSRFKDSRS